jgi:hypothetical protein
MVDSQAPVDDNDQPRDPPCIFVWKTCSRQDRRQLLMHEARRHARRCREIGAMLGGHHGRITTDMAGAVSVAARIQAGTAMATALSC